MSYRKMSFDSATFVALLFVSYVTGITGTTAEQTIYSLADVANTRQYESAIGSSDPQQYCNGMQLREYLLSRQRWNRGTILWAVAEYSTRVANEMVDEVVAKALGVWSEVIPYQFVRVSLNERPDVKIWFSTILPPTMLGVTTYFPQQLGYQGRNIVFNDNNNWTDTNRYDYCNLHNVAVHEIGHALGLDHSYNPDAVMFPSHQGHPMKEDFTLHPDDIAEIQELYGARDGQPAQRNTPEISSSKRAPPPQRARDTRP